MRPTSEISHNLGQLVDKKLGELYLVIENVNESLAEIKHVSHYMENLFDIHTNLASLVSLSTQDDALNFTTDNIDDLTTYFDNLNTLITNRTSLDALADEIAENATRAQNYANAAEDTEVETGLYSAMHFAIKAAATQLEINESVDTALININQISTIVSNNAAIAQAQADRAQMLLDDAEINSASNMGTSLSNYPNVNGVNNFDVTNDSQDDTAEIQAVFDELYNNGDGFSSSEPKPKNGHVFMPRGVYLIGKNGIGLSLHNGQVLSGAEDCLILVHPNIVGPVIRNSDSPATKGQPPTRRWEKGGVHHLNIDCQYAPNMWSAIMLECCDTVNVTDNHIVNLTGDEFYYNDGNTLGQAGYYPKGGIIVKGIHGRYGNFYPQIHRNIVRNYDNSQPQFGVGISIGATHNQHDWVDLDGATNANPCVFTKTAHGLTNGTRLGFRKTGWPKWDNDDTNKGSAVDSWEGGHFIASNVTTDTFEVEWVAHPTLDNALLDSATFPAIAADAQFSRYVSASSQRTNLAQVTHNIVVRANLGILAGLCGDANIINNDCSKCGTASVRIGQDSPNNTNRCIVQNQYAEGRTATEVAALGASESAFDLGYNSNGTIILGEASLGLQTVELIDRGYTNQWWRQASLSDDRYARIYEGDLLDISKAQIKEIVSYDETEKHLLTPRIDPAAVSTVHKYGHHISAECMTSNDIGGLAISNSGTGSGVVNQTAQQGQLRAGVLKLRTGTTDTGQAAITGQGNAVILGQGEHYFKSVMKLNDISLAPEEFSIQAGWTDDVDSNGVDGVFFKNSGGNWTANTIANNTITTVNTGIAASTDFICLEIIVDETDTATFYIEGIEVAQITTNIPTGTGRYTNYTPCGIYKRTGTAEVSVSLDLFTYQWKTNVQRYNSIR